MIDTHLLKQPAEVALYEELQRLKPLVEAAIEQRDYLGALRLTSRICPAINRFFDTVRVL